MTLTHRGRVVAFVATALAAFAIGVLTTGVDWWDFV